MLMLAIADSGSVIDWKHGSCQRQKCISSPSTHQSPCATVHLASLLLLLHCPFLLLISLSQLSLLLSAQFAAAAYVAAPQQWLLLPVAAPGAEPGGAAPQARHGGKGAGAAGAPAATPAHPKQPEAGGAPGAAAQGGSRVAACL